MCISNVHPISHSEGHLGVGRVGRNVEVSDKVCHCGVDVKLTRYRAAIGVRGSRRKCNSGRRCVGVFGKYRWHKHIFLEDTCSVSTKAKPRETGHTPTGQRRTSATLEERSTESRERDEDKGIGWKEKVLCRPKIRATARYKTSAKLQHKKQYIEHRATVPFRLPCNDGRRDLPQIGMT